MALQRGMFNRLPIKYKLLVMPAFAAIGLLVVLATSVYLGDTEEKQMRLVENDYYPSVQLSADVEKRFAALQRGLQDAVAARNTAALDEIDAMRIQLIARLDGGKRISVLDAKQVDALKASIDDYYALARDTSVRMIGGETGEGIFKSLQTMQARYTAVAESGVLTESTLVMTDAVGEPSVESLVLTIVKRTSLERTGWPSCHFAFGLM